MGKQTLLGNYKTLHLSWVWLAVNESKCIAIDDGVVVKCLLQGSVVLVRACNFSFSFSFSNLAQSF